MQPRALKTAIFALFSLILASCEAFSAATLLPNGQQCFQAQTGLNGMVGTIGTITAGSGGTAGTYAGVALTGGSGSSATANITVAGGVVTAVTVLNPGIQYVTGDVLSAASGSIGNVSGFSVPVASTSINSSLAGGKVFFYVPNTSTFKSTWFNADQTAAHQNTNPVALDQNGCAVIYGTGSYRQVVQDSLSNTVWDQVTTDTSANNNTFWAGVAGGTPNVITVVDPGFNATDGSIINFTALATNTGSATLNPSGFGAIQILKDTTGGPVALTGGEIVQNNPISVIYSAVTNAFNLLNTVIPSVNGAAAPLCGAVGLKITNGSAPSSIIALTADQIVMQTANGLVVNRSNVSLAAINITIGSATSTANGMDGEPAGTSQWLYIWAVDNGAASAGLVSTSSSAPTLPSGYNYKCRLGAMRVDGAGNLLRTLQYGSRAQYTVTPATNTASLPLIISGTAGTFSQTVPVYSAPIPIGNFAPATATRLLLTATGRYQNSTLSQGYAAPNPNYSANGGTAQPPLAFDSADTNLTTTTEFILESTNIYWVSSAAGGALVAFGWVDKVNAN